MINLVGDNGEDGGDDNGNDGEGACDAGEGMSCPYGYFYH